MSPSSPATTCYDPATGEVLGTSLLDTVEDLKRYIAKAKASQPGWAALPVKKRVEYLLRVRDYMVENAHRLAEVICRDNGKTRADAMIAEVAPSIMAVSYYCKEARWFLADRRLRPSNLMLMNKRAKIVRVPFGVVGVISPWNYPFSIPFSEVVMALLAGNTVVLKVAGETQMVGRALEECLEAARLPGGVFTHVNLPGRLAGDAFLEGGVDKLFFTGSVPVGKTLIAKAAQTLTPVSLELGGNDAMIVCADADLDRAAAGAVWGGLQNCGQSCGGVERIYVEAPAYDKFLKKLARRVEALRVGRDTDHNLDLGAMTTRKQMDLVERHVAEALEKGATVLAQSPVLAGEGNFLPARVLTEVNHSMLVMREETFGPVLGVMRVDDLEEALELANDSDLGLTGSVWSRDTKKAEALARRIRAGVVMINDHLMSHGLPETPWGGFKNSGIGRTHGELGFAEMTEPQCIVHDRLPLVKKDMWWHPHGPRVYWGMAGLLDLLYAPGWKRRLKGMWKVMRVFPRTFTSRMK